MPSRPPRAATIAVALFAALLLAAPVAAQSNPERDAAESTLEEAQRLADGRGIRSGRELSVALAQLAAARSDLNRSDRREADQLLARPIDKADVNQPGGPFDPAARVLRNCSTHFCVHWVDSTADAPPPADANSCPTPDYIDQVRTALEQSYAVQNGQLGWRAPVSDGTRGGNARTDVYIKQLNATPGNGLYGYAATDGPQSGESRYAFMVLDNDYRSAEFPQYGGDYMVPLEVTAAHEYNHVLQYGYDTFQDVWMFESTATWSEEKVFAADDDYHGYMGIWADQPLRPLTSADGLKMYGSAIWNHWLEQRYGADVIRRAWEGSFASESFAPEAYDRAIAAETDGVSFATDFADFAAATAAWHVAGSGVHEGSTFPREVARASGSLSPGDTRTRLLDHTGYVLYDVPIPVSGDPLRLTGSLRHPGTPADGAAGSIALVGLDEGSGDVTKVLARTDAAGDAVVTMPGDPARFDRITALLVNADVSTNGFDATSGDWVWKRDGQESSLSLSRVAASPGDVPIEEAPDPDVTGAAPETACGSTDVEREAAAVATPTPAPTASPTPTPTPTTTPTPTPTPATSVRLSRSTTRIRSAVRTRRLALFARTNKAGRLRAKATIDARTARRLGLRRRTTSLGIGRRTALAPSRLKIKVKLTRKARATLRKYKGRTVRIKVRVTFEPTDGTGRVTRTIAIRLRR